MASPLFTRWFQSQVFTPGFRMHLIAEGENTPWNGPAPSQKVLVDFIRLRRRLAPYVDSTDEALPLSKKDAAARGAPATLNDYLRSGEHLHALTFGPAFWVQPPPAAETHLLRLALPPGAAWIDFWSGASYAGGDTLQTPVPLEIIPAFVKAGSIIPLASLPEQAGDSAAPLEIRVYPGADGEFTLRDPAGPVSFSWDDRAGALRIRPPAGRPAGPALSRRFDIVVVRPGRGVGLHRPARPDVEADYRGAELRLTPPPPPSRPLAPKGFSATIDGAHVVFTWQAPCSSAIYRLKRVTGPGAAPEDLASALQTTRFSLPLSACEHPLECVVTAMNAGGEGPASPSVKVSLPVDERKTAPRPASAPPSRVVARPEAGGEQVATAQPDTRRGAGKPPWPAPSPRAAASALYPLAKAS